MMRKTLSLGLRAGIAGLLLVALLQAVDYGQLAEVWSNIGLLWTLGATALLTVIRILMAWRWHYILLPHGIDARLKDIVSIIFTSTSVGYLLPAGGFGVDVYRGYELSRLYGNVPQVSATIVIDRMIGLFSMVFLTLLGALLVEAVELPAGILLVVVAANAGFLLLGLSIMCWHRQTASLCGWIRGRLPRLLAPLGVFFQALTDPGIFRRVLPGIFATSMLVQILRVIVFYMIYRAVWGDPDPWILVAYIPLTFIMILMPLSLGGLGVREFVLHFFLAPHGVELITSLSAGLMFHLLEVVVAVPGVFFYLSRPRAPGEPGRSGVM